MSTLEKPTENYEPSEPAQQAGIFLGRTATKAYDLLDGGAELFQAIADTEALKRAGRYICTKAAPGYVVIESISVEQSDS